MNVLELIGLALTAAEAVVSQIKASGIAGQVLADAEAAVTSLIGVQNQATTLAELESLRTKKVW